MCIMPTLQALADALRINQTVTYVDLSENNFGDEGLKARALQRGPWLGGLWNGAIQQGDGVRRGGL